MDILQEVTFLNVIEAATFVIAACAAIAAITPTKVDDQAMMKLGKIYNIVAKVVNVLGLNVGKAKNKEADPKASEVKLTGAAPTQ